MDRSCLLLFLFLCSLLNAAESDERWVSINNGAFGNETVNAMVCKGEDLYIGGTFGAVNGVTASNIARLDISSGTWYPLGTGVDNVVWHLAMDGAGTLFASGYFQNAGGIAVDDLARWDGAAWSAVESGNVTALVSNEEGNIYAAIGDTGGYQGRQWFYEVNLWNGSTWTTIGSFNGEVTALANKGPGSLYAAGYFTAANNIAVNHIVKLTGTTATTLGNGLDNAPKMLMVDNDGILYAAGYFGIDGVPAANRVVRWDGTAWSVLGGAMNGEVDTIAVHENGDLYVGGHFTTAADMEAASIARWDGAAWHPLGSGVDGSVYALAIDEEGDLLVGGKFSTAGGKSSPFVAKWMTMDDEPAMPDIDELPEEDLSPSDKDIVDTDPAVTDNEVPDEAGDELLGDEDA
ncbi:MAG TPA: hypothetical protein P5077_12345, partial [bacterium]|nr:hypothetical protein [bacterium]